MGYCGQSAFDAYAKKRAKSEYCVLSGFLQSIDYRERNVNHGFCGRQDQSDSNSQQLKIIPKNFSENLILRFS